MAVSLDPELLDETPWIAVCVAVQVLLMARIHGLILNDTWSFKVSKILALTQKRREYVDHHFGYFAGPAGSPLSAGTHL